MIGQCRLCLEKDKKLLNKSHVVPRYFYKDLFSQSPKHKIQSLRLINGKYIPQKHLSQDSLFESGLLCGDCDNGIINQRYEQYFLKTIYDPIKKFSKCLSRPNDLYPHDFTSDYDIIKLFSLSILWRYSILQRPENPPVDLGEHKEIIRKMIFENDPKTPLDYSFCLFCSLNKESGHETKWSFGPVLIRVNNSFPYQILLPGFVLLIWLPSVSRGSPYLYIGKNDVRVLFTSGDVEKMWINHMVRNIDFNSFGKSLNKE